jgi:flagellar assembly protein FliH
LPDVLDFELVGTSAIPAELLERSQADASAVGYAHGWAQGLRQARESMRLEAAAARAEIEDEAARTRSELAMLLTSLVNAAAQLRSEQDKAATRNEDAILAAAVDIAEALVGHQLRDVGAETVAALARALRLMPGTEPVTLRLNAEVHRRLAADNFATVLDAVLETTGRTIAFAPDSSLGVGDVIAVSASTTVDARIAEGVRRVREQLSGEIT